MSAGLTLLYDGGAGMLGGNWRPAAAMAACTSCAAASRLRLRLNCSVIEVDPSDDDETIESRPAIVENCRSSGVATAEAIVSGLAPGSDAFDVDRREVDVRQIAHRQLPVGHDSEQHDGEHDQRRHDRAADEEGGDVHGVGCWCSVARLLGQWHRI